MHDPASTYVVFADEDRLIQQLFHDEVFEPAGGPSVAKLITSESTAGVLALAKTYQNAIRLYVLSYQLGPDTILGILGELRRASPEAYIAVRCGPQVLLTREEAVQAGINKRLWKEMDAHALIDFLGYRIKDLDSRAPAPAQAAEQDSNVLELSRLALAAAS